MQFARRLACALSALALVLASVAPAAGQFRGRIYVSGLTRPLAFVQDPSNAGIQFVAQQDGVIRIVQGGTLLPAPFLDLSGLVGSGGERGFLGLAFPPNYASTGRFYVTFANTDGHLVLSRFHRSLDPLAADPASRFDLQWSTRHRYIEHPFELHYGGCLAFGADGYLYVSTGDGGEPHDPSHQAQNPSSLLGKVLRLDVGVSDEDPEGFDVPAGNPFAGGGGAPEVWALGLRNPWRFSVDDPARGGTGALVIADVGEDAFEEFNYEPAGRPGRNYGWRNREGAHDHDMSLPPHGPLTDPTFEYDHSFGRSITGGFIYRGSGNASMNGRYVFGDFVRGRIWSVAIGIDPGTSEATASDFRDHTSDISAGAAIGQISSFGVDAAGELYVVCLGSGTVVALQAVQLPTPLLQIDTPSAGSSVGQPFLIAGWAIDAAASTPGISTLHLWAFPQSGAPRFLGVATQGISRPDVAAAFGPQFGSSGYGLTVRGLAPGYWTIGVYGWVDALQGFHAAGSVPVVVRPSGMLAIDLPVSQSNVTTPFILGGWAIDPAAVSGTGISTIHVWGFPAEGTGPPVFLGVPPFVARPDVAAAFGDQYYNGGYHMGIASLPAGAWDLLVFAMSSVSNAFDTVNSVRVIVR
jgi:glucose/arabinose dehydrogenase